MEQRQELEVMKEDIVPQLLKILMVLNLQYLLQLNLL